MEEKGARSVNDRVMGTIESDEVCLTCHQDNITCPGHYGMIRLAEPIVHPLFLGEVMAVLTCVCNSCGGLLLREDEIKAAGIDKLQYGRRLRVLAERCKKNPCRRVHKAPEGKVRKCTPNPTYQSQRIKSVEKILYTSAGKREQHAGRRKECR